MPNYETKPQFPLPSHEQMPNLTYLAVKNASWQPYDSGPEFSRCTHLSWAMARFTYVTDRHCTDILLSMVMNLPTSAAGVDWIPTLLLLILMTTMMLMVIVARLLHLFLVLGTRHPHSVFHTFSSTNFVPLIVVTMSLSSSTIKLVPEHGDVRVAFDIYIGRAKATDVQWAKRLLHILILPVIQVNASRCKLCLSAAANHARMQLQLRHYQDRKRCRLFKTVNRIA